MRVQVQAALVVGVVSTACGTSTPIRDASGADASSSADAAAASNRFDIRAQRITIQHDRPDLVLEKLWMAFYCLPRTSGIGGVTLDRCGVLSVDGVPNDGFVEFPVSAKDGVDTKPISFEFSTPAENVFCVGMKVLFQGVSNEIDSTLYVDIADRYSILSYCTETTLPAQHAEQPRWAHRRESTFMGFLRRLSQPIPLALRPKQ